MHPDERIKQDITEGLQRGQTLKDLEAQLQYQAYGKRAVLFQRIAMARNNEPKERQKHGGVSP